MLSTLCFWAMEVDLSLAMMLQTLVDGPCGTVAKVTKAVHRAVILASQLLLLCHTLLGSYAMHNGSMHFQSTKNTI